MTIAPWSWVRGLRLRISTFRKGWQRILDARISIVAIGLGVLLLTLSQGLDVVRDLVDWSNLFLRTRGVEFRPDALATYARWAYLLIACIWSGVIAWYWPLLLTRSRTLQGEPPWFTWLRRLLGVAPLLAATAAVTVTGRDHIRDVWIAMVLLVTTTIALLVFFIMREKLINRFFAGSWLLKQSRLLGPLVIRLGGRPESRLTRGDDTFVIFSFALSLAVLLIFSLPVARTVFASHVGAASIAFGAVGSIIAMVSALAWVTAGVRLPVVTIGALSAIAFSIVNDNHTIREVPSGELHRRLSVEEAYRIWDRKTPQGPLVLVAAAGGASRAAYWTETVLRALDDQTGGRFARNVFAISSVSGGSLAAAGYAAWTADHPPGTGKCGYSAETRHDFDGDFFGGDFLSPALAGMLYPDLFQLFMPFPLFQDRASSLEEAWNLEWRKQATWEASLPCGNHSTAKADRMSGDFLELWTTAFRTGAPWVPLVLLNGTLVETGKRVITAPIIVDPAIFEDSHDFYKLFGRAVSTTTAVMNSARFPLVSPAATVPVEGGSLHIVDGGYFENGGIETTYDLARYLRVGLGVKRPILIVEINNDDSIVDDPDAEGDLARYANNAGAEGAINQALKVALPRPEPAGPAAGLTSIIRAFYMTRTSRGVLAAKRLSATRAAYLGNTYRATFNLGPLIDQRRTAMSWSISLSSEKAMDNALLSEAHSQPQFSAVEIRELGATLRCQRLMVSQIAASIIYTATPGSRWSCNPESFAASSVGVPLNPQMLRWPREKSFGKR